MSSAEPTLSPPAPQLAKPSQRIDSLDLLRGIAILGIFLMNTWTMSFPQYAYTNPSSYSPDWIPGYGFPVSGGTVNSIGDDFQAPLTGANFWAYAIIHLIADMKFITTFSILFGAGIVLQADRSRKKGHNPWKIHYLRMAILLLFGLAHSFGFWYGDILTDYALLGMVLAPARKLPAGTLFFLGLTLVFGVTFLDYAKRHDWFNFFFDSMTSWDNWVRYHWGYAPIDPRTGNPYYPFNELELHAYRGKWWEQIREHRFVTSVLAHTSEMAQWTFWRCGGCMLLGMSLQKRRFFLGAWSREVYATLSLLCAPIGWVLIWLGIQFNQNNLWHDDTNNFFALWHLGIEFNYWGSLLCAFGYISFGVLLAIWAADPPKPAWGKEFARQGYTPFALIGASFAVEPFHGLFRRCLVPIRAVGRMALSCYLTETLIGTTLFYGHGFGLFGKLSRPELVYKVVLPAWAFILLFATVWLSIFRQGPLEWIWHSLVYWDWQNPLKSAAGPDVALTPTAPGNVETPASKNA